MSLSPLRHFVLAALLWLPSAFLLWFLLAGPIVWPVAKLTGWVLPLLVPDTVTAVVLAGAQLEIETRLMTAADAAGRQGLLVLQVQPLIYAWCLPLFAGLVMATPLTARQRALQFLVGLPLLWLVVSWGSAFNVLKILGFDAGPLGLAAVEAAGWSLDGIALGYQFGYLILPAVTPVATWVVLNRAFLETLVGWDGEPPSAAAGPSNHTPPEPPPRDPA